jgi:hypothetical protein
VSTAAPELGPTTSSGADGNFLPQLLFMVAFLGWGAIQTTQLVSDRLALQVVGAQQSGQLEAAHKIRMAADSLAAKTLALADRGNPDAKLVIAKLKERGVTINPNAQGSSSP